MSKESIFEKLSGGSGQKSVPQGVHVRSNVTDTSGCLETVRNILSIIKSSGNDGSMYTSDKKAISFIFREIPEPYSFSSILLKLTVIDSLYSTQMGRRYYGLDELAAVLADIHKGKSLDSLFRSLASGNISSKDACFCVRGTNLFTEKYGIGKDGNDKGTAVSLISKYAY